MSINSQITNLIKPNCSLVPLKKPASSPRMTFSQILNYGTKTISTEGVRVIMECTNVINSMDSKDTIKDTGHHRRQVLPWECTVSQVACLNHTLHRDQGLPATTHMMPLEGAEIRWIKRLHYIINIDTAFQIITHGYQACQQSFPPDASASWQTQPPQQHQISAAELASTECF